MLKVCSRCGVAKPRDDFNKRRLESGRYSVKSACKECMAKMRKSKYGLTITAYEALLAAQGGVCAICNGPETAKDGRYGRLKLLSVDHCHRTGVIRGLLCDNCNRAIGLFQDNPETMAKALSYVSKAKKSNNFNT